MRPGKHGGDLLKNKETISLEPLKKSKKVLRPGDIFVLKPKGHDYYFGRVINTHAQCGFGPPKAILIYIYNSTAKDKDVIPDLDKHNLLIPPVMINRLGWSRGYFENVSFRRSGAESALFLVSASNQRIIESKIVKGKIYE